MLMSEATLNAVPITDHTAEVRAREKAKAESRARWDAIRHHERRASVFRELAEEHNTKATRLLRAQLRGEEA